MVEVLKNPGKGFQKETPLPPDACRHRRFIGIFRAPVFRHRSTAKIPNTISIEDRRRLGTDWKRVEGQRGKFREHNSGDRGGGRSR